MQILDVTVNGDGDGSITIKFTEEEAQQLAEASLRHPGAPFGKDRTMTSGFVLPVSAAFLAAYDQQREANEQADQQQELPLDA